jgi:tRNA-splicing ligase RtcB (3'-phosphate/5'-hydroxy nucleic acid ligase)
MLLSMQITPTPGVPIKAWTDGVPIEPEAMEQAQNLARMPFVFRHVALMPDVHKGIGATVGSVVATQGAIIPAAVGVDIGCGMMAVETTLAASQLPEDLKPVRRAIEIAVPHGRTDKGGRNDRGAWGRPPPEVQAAWGPFESWLKAFSEKHPKIADTNGYRQLGTLGTGNHFIEVCIDERDKVWFMLHSGSRHFGNRIGSYFIELAKRDMWTALGNLPDRDLAYFKEGAKHFDDYVEAVGMAQHYARQNRELMMRAVVSAVHRVEGLPPFETTQAALNCHHNYVERERHFGTDVLVTRKGAVRARAGDLGIIPGSMGARSYIVRGKGNPQSFESCSHGAGRIMSRTEAKKRFTLADHEAATAGVECRKDKDVIDETPGAYKDIDAVMAAQEDLVDVEHTLKQVVCVKG